MDPTWLYYALSTIAQCAAALAALIGFLGLWRLDRLREEREHAIQMIYRQANFSQLITGLGLGQEIARLGDEYFVQRAEEYTNVLELENGRDSQAKLELKRVTARWRAVPVEQRRLMHALYRFLGVTLAILVLAIVGIPFVGALHTWPWTVTILIMLASLSLGVGPAYVVREAARSVGAIIMLALLALASPAWTGDTGNVTSPPNRTLIRSVPAGNVYSYENAAGETVEETENRQGKLINRRFYRPAPPACAYLRSVGLSTDHYWRDDGERLFHCLSSYKELGTVAEPLGLGQKNNLAYYVDGDAERIHQMMLVLNVNQRHEAKQAHQEFLRVAKTLTQQALNTPLPKATEQAITAGKPWQGTVKVATLELTRDDWPTGKGYELKLLVRLAGQTP